MSVSSEDAARGVVGRPHAGNTASALAGIEKVRSSDGTQRARALREMRPRAWLAVTRATRPDEAGRAWRLNRGVGLRRTCRVRRPRSMPARARLRKDDEPSRFNFQRGDSDSRRAFQILGRGVPRLGAHLRPAARARVRVTTRFRRRSASGRGGGRVAFVRPARVSEQAAYPSVVNDWKRPARRETRETRVLPCSPGPCPGSPPCGAPRWFPRCSWARTARTRVSPRRLCS